MWWLYHILNGKLSPLHRIGPQDLRLEELRQRVLRDEVKEIILATSTDMEGETTASFIHDMLEDVEGLAITRIALGIPVGADLSYADSASMALAISKRRNFD